MRPMRRPPRRIRKPVTLFGLGLLLLPLALPGGHPEPSAARLLRVQLPDSVIVGSTKAGVVIFDDRVASDSRVSLQSSNTSVWSSPSEVVVQRGRRHRGFGVQPQRAGCTSVAARYDGTVRTGMLTVHGRPNSAIRLDFPWWISPIPGQRTRGYVVLSSTGGATRISLSSSNTSVASVPTSVPVRVGQTRIPFTITTGSALNHTTCAVITASIPVGRGGTTSVARTVRQAELGG